MDSPICPPALVYLIFSMIQVIIDAFNGFYQVALLKLVIVGMITFLLNAICQNGMGFLAWFMVFIPFIFMTVSTTLLVYNKTV